MAPMNHNNLFRFLLLEKFKSVELINDSKLPPIDGANKAAKEVLKKRSTFYID